MALYRTTLNKANNKYCTNITNDVVCPIKYSIVKIEGKPGGTTIFIHVV